MKWFTDYPKPKNDIELAEYCIDYLQKHGQREERYKTVGKLYKLISNKVLPNNLLKKIIHLDYHYLTMRIATKADNEILQYMIDHPELIDQEVLASILYNDSLTKEQAREVSELCDTSRRGHRNKEIIYERWNIVLGYRIGDIVEILDDSSIEYQVKDDLFVVIDNPFVKQECVDLKRIDDDFKLKAVPTSNIRPARAPKVAKWRRNQIFESVNQ